MNKLTTVLVVFLACVAVVPAFSATDQVDVVTLKNGSIIKGTIIEQVPGESLKIETADGSLFVFKMAEVERISKEKAEADASAPRSTRREGGLFFGAGYAAVLTTSPDDGVLNATYDAPSGALKIGGTFTEHFGVVFAFEFSSNDDRSAMVSKLGPVYRAGRVQLYGTGGFVLGEPLWNSGSGQGPYVGAGIDVELANKLGIYVDAGICLWGTTFDKASGTNSYLEPLTSVALAIGVSWGN